MTTKEYSFSKERVDFVKRGAGHLSDFIKGLVESYGRVKPAENPQGTPWGLSAIVGNGWTKHETPNLHYKIAPEFKSGCSVPDWCCRASTGRSGRFFAPAIKFFQSAIPSVNYLERLRRSDII